MALENFAHLIWRESLSLVHFMALPLVLLFPFKLTLKRIQFLCAMLIFRLTVIFLSPGQFFSTQTHGGPHCAHISPLPTAYPTPVIPLLLTRSLPPSISFFPIAGAARPSPSPDPARCGGSPSSPPRRSPGGGTNPAAALAPSIGALATAPSTHVGNSGGHALLYPCLPPLLGPKLRRRWWRPGAAAPVVGGRSEAGEAGSGGGGCGSGGGGSLSLPPCPAARAAAGRGGRRAASAGAAALATSAAPCPIQFFFGFFFIQIFFDVLFFVLFHLINFSTVKIFLVIFFMSPIFVS